MLNPFARLLLVATSLAPIAVIYFVSRLSRDLTAHAPWRTILVDAGPYGLGAVALVLMCMSLIRLVRTAEKHLITIAKSKSADKDVVVFIVAYALPLVFPADKTADIATLVAFIGLTAAALFQSSIMHVNPLLGLVGYRFREISVGEDTVLLISRKKNRSVGPVNVVKLSEDVWLEMGPNAL